MITQLKKELDRINQEIERFKEMLKDYPTPSMHPWLARVEAEKETLKKVNLMWADEMLKILNKTDYETIWKHKSFLSLNRLHKECNEIKSLMEKEEC
jgi:hypothetical protein